MKMTAFTASLCAAAVTTTALAAKPETRIRAEIPAEFRWDFSPIYPSWGTILSEARPFIREAPWMMILPGIALTVTVLSLNLMGDGLRDLLDPRLRRRAQLAGP